MSKSLDDLLADISARIASGLPPWRQPWASGGEAASPLRADGAPFSGSNAWSLAWLGAERGHGSPYWLSFNQALKIGAVVRKGERASPAVFYKQAVRPGPGDRRDREAELADAADAAAIGQTEPGERRFLKTYGVFNAEQLDGAPEAMLRVPAVDPVLRAAARCAAFDAIPARIDLTGFQACYLPALDLIRLPPPERFDSLAAFLATKAHELAHWTGAAHRLNRQFGARFGDQAYAFEELVAELASVLLGLRLGLPPADLDSHAAYLGHWARLLKDRPRALLEASSHAQRAVDLLLSFGARGDCPAALAA